MPSLIELKQQCKAALAKADAILSTAENAGRQITDSENMAINACMDEVNVLQPKIRQVEASNTITRKFKNPVELIEGSRSGVSRVRKTLTAEYESGFFKMIQSAGKNMSPALDEGSDGFGGFVIPSRPSAALYEGSNTAGGYAVPIVVDDQIVPLAPQEMSVRRLATVIPTSSDIKFPIKASFGTATAKAETSSFTESDTTLGQFTLSAFMAGIQETVSWELAQDVPAFQAFTVDDMLLAQQMYEENLYVNGTGSGQAQGLIGNVGTGFGPQEPDSNGNLVSIVGTLNLIGTLNAVYHPNASFLMSRLTSIVIRKAQVQANLFEPVWVRQGKQDFLHGYPVEYSAYMPSASRGNTPLLFGDFKRGYIIGDRGGSGINVKVLDQVAAQQGEIVLLAYRRTDGRVRRSEAIQAYEVALS